MSLRGYVASLFARPKPDAREELNKAAFTQEQQRAAHEKAQQEQADLKMEADIVAKQTALMQSHLTPERTPFGTQPKPPLTEKQARDLAEKRVVAAHKDQQRGGNGTAKEDDKVQAKPKQATGQEHDPMNGEEVTPAAVAEVVQWQAVHEITGEEERGAASRTAAERDARIAARVAEIEAERTGAALDHSHTHGDGGRTI